MKKYICLLLALVLMLSLAACKKEKASEPVAQKTTPQTEISNQTASGTQSVFLQGYTMNKLYSELYKSKGCLDGEDFGPVTRGSDYGFGSLNAAQYTDSVLDTGITEDGGYMIAMFRLESSVDVQEFVYSLQSVADPWQLPGEGVQYVVAWGGDVVVYFAATGTLCSQASTMEQLFINTYATTTTGITAQ